MFTVRFAVLILAAATGLSASPIPDDQPNLIARAKPIKVPGHSPLFYCDNPANDILKIDHADWNPFNPVAGQDLTVTIAGKLKAGIKSGSKVTYQAKLEGILSLFGPITESDSLCSWIGGGCPVAQGSTTIKKRIPIDQMARGKTANIHIEAKNEHGQRITCMKATVKL